MYLLSTTTQPNKFKYSKFNLKGGKLKLVLIAFDFFQKDFGDLLVGIQEIGGTGVSPNDNSILINTFSMSYFVLCKSCAQHYQFAVSA